MRLKRVLITGFIPFLHHDQNPSEMLVRHMTTAISKKAQVIGAILPVSFSGVKDFCDKLSKWDRFDAIVLTGLSARYDAIVLEQRAINCQKSKSHDNDGFIPNGTPVIEGGPEFIDSTIDVVEIAARMNDSERPVRASLSAGSYVCNDLYYRVLHRLDGRKPPVIFVHIPELKGSWTLESVSRIIESIALDLCRGRSQVLRKPRTITSMAAAENFLYSFINYERKTGVAYTEENYSLQRYKDFLKFQGNPHQRGQHLHVAGTKGKGCVSTLIASILSAHGLRTGLYTSPHLVDIRERIRLDGKAISESDFVSLAAEQQQFALNYNRNQAKTYRTTFELLTSMAFHYFDRLHTDWNVLETGLGGRLDCTNVVEPVASAITRIDMDHMDSLGNSLLKIAAEKAGIMKENTTTVSGHQIPPVAQFLRRYAVQANSRLVFSAGTVQVKNVIHDTAGTTFSARLSGHWFHRFRINLPGVFQFENCRLALSIIAILTEKKLLDPMEDSIRTGLSQATWPGRFMQIQADRFESDLSGYTVIIDGAHNPRAMLALMTSVRRLYPEKPISVIIGSSSNKDASGMLRIASGFARRIIVTTFSGSRAFPVKAFSAIARQSGIPVVEAPDVKTAVNHLKTCIIPDEIIVVTGSLFLVGDCLTSLEMKDLCLDVF